MNNYQPFVMMQIDAPGHPFHGQHYVADATDGEPQTEPKPCIDQAVQAFTDMHIRSLGHEPCPVLISKLKGSA